MECAMEVVETAETPSPKKSESHPPVESPSHVESDEKESSSQAETSCQKEPLPQDLQPAFQVAPSAEAAPASQAESPSQALSPSSSSSSLPNPSVGAIASSVSSSLTNGPAPKKQRLDYNSMSTGAYLDSTVVPILHVALVTLDRLRPSDPVQFVIDFLLRNKAQFSKTKEQPSTSTNQA